MGDSWAWADFLEPNTLGTPRTPEFNTGPAQIMHTVCQRAVDTPNCAIQFLN